MKKLILLISLFVMAAGSVKADPIIDVKTTMGDFKIKLYDDTPIHRDNFLKLVNEGFYDGILFHRVINDFMVQTGDPNSKNPDNKMPLGSGDPGYKLDAEIKYPTHFHKYGALAAARTGDAVNPERRSSGSQFYIVTGTKQDPQILDWYEENQFGQKIPEDIRETYKNVGGTPHLDGQYTVFGEVIEGMDVIDRIQKAETGANDQPVKDIRIISMKVE